MTMMFFASRTPDKAQVKSSYALFLDAIRTEATVEISSLLRKQLGYDLGVQHDHFLLAKLEDHHKVTRAVAGFTHNGRKFKVEPEGFRGDADAGEEVLQSYVVLPDTTEIKAMLRQKLLDAKLIDESNFLVRTEDDDPLQQFYYNSVKVTKIVDNFTHQAFSFTCYINPVGEVQIEDMA